MMKTCLINIDKSCLLYTSTGKPWKESWCYEHGIADYVAETAGEDTLTPVFSCESEAVGRDREDQPDYKVRMSAAFCFSNKMCIRDRLYPAGKARGTDFAGVGRAAGQPHCPGGAAGN